MPYWKVRTDLWWGQVWGKHTELSGKCIALRGGWRALNYDIFSPGPSPRISKSLSQKNFPEFILTSVPNTMQEAWTSKCVALAILRGGRKEKQGVPKGIFFLLIPAFLTRALVKTLLWNYTHKHMPHACLQAKKKCDYRGHLSEKDVKRLL